MIASSPSSSQSRMKLTPIKPAPPVTSIIRPSLVVWPLVAAWRAFNPGRIARLLVFAAEHLLPPLGKFLIRNRVFRRRCTGLNARIPRQVAFVLATKAMSFCLFEVSRSWILTLPHCVPSCSPTHSGANLSSDGLAKAVFELFGPFVSRGLGMLFARTATRSQIHEQFAGETLSLAE